MTNRNTMSKRAYFFHTLFWLIYGMFSYQYLIFCELPGISQVRSMEILWFGAIILTALGLLITFRHRRNDTSITVNVLLPLEIYTVITYYIYMPKAVGLIALTALSLSVAFILIVLRQKITPGGRPVSLKKRLTHGALGARVIIAYCLILLTVPVTMCTVVGTDTFADERESIPSAERANVYISENRDESILLFKDSIWNELTVQERVSALNAIVNGEIRYLGINHEITLTSAELDGIELAHYNPRLKAIVVNSEYLKNCTAVEAMDAVCHECYHAYQYQQVALYNNLPDDYKSMLMFCDAKVYSEEFTNYISGEENYSEYYSQQCETDARTYAEMAVAEYKILIDEYNNN